MDKIILFILMFSSLAFAKVDDQTNKLESVVVENTNSKILDFEKRHDRRIEIVVVNNFIESPEKDAKSWFTRKNMTNRDILYLVSLNDKASRFWIGKLARISFDGKSVKAVHEAMKSIYQKKEYEQSFSVLISSLDQIFTKSEENFKSRREIFSILLLIASFLVITISIFSYYNKREKMKIKYPGVNYDRAVALENFKDTKAKIRYLLYKQYPDEPIYKSYRRIAKEFKKNKISQSRVNRAGEETDFSTLAITGAIPIYVLMFNSPYSSLDYGRRKANEDGSSSGCSSALSACGSSGGDGCGGGGCGGGGCGGGD